MKLLRPRRCAALIEEEGVAGGHVLLVGHYTLCRSYKENRSVECVPLFGPWWSRSWPHIVPLVESIMATFRAVSGVDHSQISCR